MQTGHRDSNIRPLALVTGASTGIGYELAKCCAEKGFDLLIANESEIETADKAGAANLATFFKSCLPSDLKFS
jgi:short-subunit dehydrogenase